MRFCGDFPSRQQLARPEDRAQPDGVARERVGAALFAVDAFIDTITETLKGGGEVSFTGFGKFSTSNRAARQGVNPRTGERVQIAAARVPKFSAGSALKQAVKS